MPVDPTYSSAPGGSLKLKGSQHKKKKKSSSSKSKKELSLKGEEVHLAKGKQRSEEETEDSTHNAQAGSSGPAMTEAERRFEETRRKRMAEKVAKEAKLSHKERVDQFNTHLANLTEHFDLPKVGPG